MIFRTFCATYTAHNQADSDWRPTGLCQQLRRKNIYPPYSPQRTAKTSILKLSGIFHRPNKSMIRYRVFSYAIGEESTGCVFYGTSPLKLRCVDAISTKASSSSPQTDSLRLTGTHTPRWPPAARGHPERSTVRCESLPARRPYPWRQKHRQGSGLQRRRHLQELWRAESAL